MSLIKEFFFFKFQIHKFALISETVKRWSETKRKFGNTCINCQGVILGLKYNSQSVKYLNVMQFSQFVVLFFPNLKLFSQKHTKHAQKHANVAYFKNYNINFPKWLLFGHKIGNSNCKGPLFQKLRSAPQCEFDCPTFHYLCIVKFIFIFVT